MKGFSHSVSIGALAVALGVVSTPAYAQQNNAVLPDQEPASAAPTLPDDSKDAKDKDEGTDITVTGTRLGRPNIASPSPIVSVSAAEIRQQGAVNVYDVLNRLPQIAPDNQAVYQDGTGQQQVKLRGLGPNRTLSLIDGQRISTSIGIDINSVPLALIDRIDVLTGGAASVYGADAVAGVVNFILKKKFEGFQISASSGGYLHNNSGNNLGARTATAAGIVVPRGTDFDGGTLDVSIAAGHNFFDDRLSVEGYGSYTETSAILTDDRDYSSCYLQQPNGRNTAPACSVDAFTQPFGSFAPQSPLAGTNQGKVFSDAKNGSRTFVANDPSFNYFNFSGNYLLQPSKRYNGGVFLNADLTSNLSFYANYNMNYQTSRVQHGPFYGFRIFNRGDYGATPADWTINCNNPLLSAQQQGVICGAAAGTTQQVPVTLRSLINATFYDEFTNFTQRVSSGVRGKFLDDALKFDANFVYSRFELKQSSAPNNGRPNLDRLQQSLLVGGTAAAPVCLSGTAGCVPADFFVANNTNPALVDWLYGTTRGISKNISSLFDYTANAQLDLGKFGITSPGAKEGLALGAGLEYRLDRQVNAADAAFISQKGGGALERSQNVKEAYVEVSLPLLQDKLYTHLLSLTGSHRWSKYDYQPQTFTTWQVGGLYAPVPDITFRVSYNKASRAPTLYERDSPILSFVGGSGDPCGTTPAVPPSAGNPNGTPAIPPTATQAQCANTGVTAAQYGNIPQCQNNSCLARGGGSQITPETAHTLTYGLIAKPRFIPGLTFSVDYFKLRVDDSIGFSYDSDFVNGCIQFGIPFYCSRIVRNPNGSLTSAATFQQGTIPTTGFVIYGSFNAYRVTTRGYDFQGQYNLPVAPLKGALDFNFNGTLTTLSGGQDSPAIGPRNGSGYFGPFVGDPQPKWRHTLRTTYSNDAKDFSISFNWRHISAVTLSTNSGEPLIGGTPGQSPTTLFGKIPAYEYFDLSVSRTFDRRLTLALVANNIFDKQTPVLSDSYCGNYGCYLSRANTIARTYDPLGRFIQIRASVNF